MEFFMISAITTIVVSSIPLVFAEAFTRARRIPRNAEFHRYHRRLWLATIAVWAPLALWYWLDSRAIAAFQRPFVVTGANVLAFAVVFLGFAARIVWPSQQDGVEPQRRKPWRATE
ncbi:MAG: hypothetical protein MOB07_06135 [Acidobacteria bacterium]|nr:hypothetical protein [Acidobacteriota bacterium]